MPRHTARGIILRNAQLLLIERWRDDLHYFSVPGGGIEKGETPEQTVIREIHEETGCQVTISRKLYVLHLDEGTRHHIYLCAYQSGTPHLPANSPEAQLDDPNNRFEPRWVEQDEIVDTPFYVWEPIKLRLLEDLEHGFDADVRELREL